MYLRNILILSISLFLSMSGFSQIWQAKPIPGKQIKEFHFLNNFLGYAIAWDSLSAKDVLINTDNSGDSWTEMNLPVEVNELQDMYFYDWGIGGIVIRNMAHDTTPTMVFKTGDNGQNWENISPDSTVAGIGTAQIQFLDAQTGFFITGNMFYRSLDGGESWNQTQMEGECMSLDFLDSNHGTVGLFDGTFNYFGGIATTTDGGMSWRTTHLNDENGTVIGEVNQIEPGISFAAPVKWGSYGHHKIYHTSDSGASWDTISVPIPFEDSKLGDMHFVNQTVGYISVSDWEKTYNYMTFDGGGSWQLMDSILQNHEHHDLQIVGTTGYMAGSWGIFYKLGTGMNVEKQEVKPITLYPNPIQSGNFIRWKGEDRIETIVISDITGKVVYRRSIRSQMRTRIPNLSPGTYLLELKNDQVINSSRLLVK